MNTQSGLWQDSVTYLPTYQLTCLPTYLLTYSLPTYLLAYSRTSLHPTCLPAYLPTCRLALLLTQVGLWQNPMQIAAALIHVGSRVAVHRYIEVGVYTAWTCGFVSTFLRRVGTPGAFRAHAVDITHSAIATGTRTLLPRINVSYISRDKLVLPPEHPFYDFCFIDGDHRYSGVLRDYDAFSPSCTYMMFHDIQDTSTLHLGNFSGGVPLFWAHLRAHVRPSRLAEFTHQPPEVPFPTFGLGVVAPNEQRTSAPDVAVSQWPHWSDFDSGDASAEPLARELCRFNHTRLCQMGAHGILNGQKAHLWAAKKSS